MKTFKMSKNDDDIKQLLIDMLPVIITGAAIIVMEILDKMFRG